MTAIRLPNDGPLDVAIKGEAHGLTITINFRREGDAERVTYAIRDALRGGGVRLTFGGDLGFGIEGFKAREDA
jgi:hypothetical protein